MGVHTGDLALSGIGQQGRPVNTKDVETLTQLIQTVMLSGVQVHQFPESETEFVHGQLDLTGP